MSNLHLIFISNRATQRLLRLLSVMESTTVFTIGEMAEKMQVTYRTIANDIKFIKDYFVGCVTLTSGHTGFSFKEINPLKYRERKQNLLKNECFFEIIKNIFLGKYMRVDELAHHYHFSESTFRRLLGQSSPILAEYGLKWGLSPLTIEGNEANVRKFFKDLYYESSDMTDTLVPDSELPKCFMNQLQEKFGHNDIGSITAPAAFYYTLYIAIQRARIGFSVAVPKELMALARKGKSFVLICSIKEVIKNIYGTDLSEEEFAWIYLVTICERTVDREETEKNFYLHFNHGAEIANLTDEYLKEFEVEKDIKDQVNSFLRSFFLSRKINHILAPVLNKESPNIKERLLRSNNENYYRNLRFLRKNQQEGFLATPYLEDICVSLTIYNNLVFNFCAPSKNIYFLLEGDHYASQQLRTQAVQHFGTKHSLTFLPLKSLTKEQLNEASVDLIVTNYSRYISEYVIETDYLLIKVVPDEQDWCRLERKINPYKRKLF